MKSILDPSFQYTNSLETDLRKTFARVRREMEKEQQQAATATTNVQPLRPSIRLLDERGLASRATR